MAWCPKCKNEYREGIQVCAECGCALVEESELEEMEKQKDTLHNCSVENTVYEDEDEIEGDREPEAKPYVNSAIQAEENRSSAWTLLVIGGLGILGIILCITGIIPLRIGNPYLFYGVMSAVFLLFVVMGAVSMKNAKIFAKKAESENSLRDSLLKWCCENLTMEIIDGQIENAEDLSVEILYFKRYEIIKQMMNHQFMNLDQGFLEKLIDDEVYDMVFDEK